MSALIKSRAFICSSSRFLLFIFVAICFIIIVQIITPKIKLTNVYIHNKPNIKNYQNPVALGNSSREKIYKDIFSFTNLTFIHYNKTLETTIRCIGSLYNQSCLYRNLYYFDSGFIILTVKGRYLPLYSVRTDAFNLWPITPNKREFDSYSDLEIFVYNVINPKLIPSVTLYFGQPWHHNIGHALFDGLYPAYVALIRFSPRHLYPFRILCRHRRMYRLLE